MDFHEQFASALAWLCAYFRSSSFKGICMSQAVAGSKTGVITLQLHEIIPIPAIPQSACWHRLFQNVVIASDFPPRARSKGFGLEISFLDLANIANSIALVEVDGGLVLDGLVTLAYPVSVLPEDDAIQWHLMLKDTSFSQMQTAEARMAALGSQGWHRELDAKKLATTRLFVGWANNAFMKIGADNTLASRISVSGAFDSDRYKTVMSYGGSFGVGYKGLPH